MDFENIYQESIKKDSEKLQEGMKPTEAAQVIKMSLLHDRDKWEETMGSEITEAVESLMMNSFHQNTSFGFI